MFRVGYDIRPALFGTAGISRYARELAVALSYIEDGPFLEFFAPTWRGGAVSRKLFRENRFRIHRGFLPARLMQTINKFPGLDAGRWPAKVDLFHWTDYVYPKVTSAATVMTLHDAAFAVDPTFHGWKTSTLLERVRHAINNSNVVIVVSEPGVHDAELMGANPENVHIVPNGVSPIFCPVDNNADEDGYILTVGTLEPRKNYLRILQAMENLWDKDAAPDWVIVGKEGWDYAEFLGRMKNSRHHKRIRWLRETDDAELVRTYQNCLALVYPSLHEGFGLPVLEAMACRKAVVVADKTAPSWVAGDGAMRVQPRSVDSIQEGIERILSENAWRRQAAAVLQLRAQEFSWEKAAEKTHLAYQDALLRNQKGILATV